MKNINSWSDINWSLVNLNVYRLQLRIFRASMQKDWAKVHKLQKLLLSSESAKFFALRRVEEHNIRFSSGKVIYLDRLEKLHIAINLFIDGRVESTENITQRVELCRRFVTKDRAKQELALLALIPQWEAILEHHNYGSRS